MALGAGAPPPPLIFLSLCCAELHKIILNSVLESPPPLSNHVPTLLISARHVLGVQGCKVDACTYVCVCVCVCVCMCVCAHCRNLYVSI